MLHRCPECTILYLVSDYSHLCNGCGEYLRRRIEQLHEVDDAVEWWQVACQVASGEQVRGKARWEIR